MKRLLSLLIVALYIISSFSACSYGTRQDYYSNKSVIEGELISLKDLNDSIDQQIRNMVLSFRVTKTTFNDILELPDFIESLNNDISVLKERLGTFSTNYNYDLDYDTDMFEQYDSIIEDLYEWQEEALSFYNSDKGLDAMRKNSSYSNRASIIGATLEIIELEKPDYTFH